MYFLSAFTLQISIDPQDEVSRDPSTHGAMFISIVAGSDKTVASVATGHQEFHPVYIGPGNIDNPTRRAHGIGILLCAFLPIPKGIISALYIVINTQRILFLFIAGPHERSSVEYQRFCRQLYHACLAYIYNPLKPAMTSPKIVQCPDGHFRQAIFSIGPYIADYPEQVWLSGIVSN